jgi:hypothetical protein
MVDPIRFTLVSDGSSDQALLPILSWLLRDHVGRRPVVGQWADLGSLPRPPKPLRERIRDALEYWPCDLLCVHRDAEGAPLAKRRAEVRQAVEAMGDPAGRPPAVCVVPVRMVEAWLLLDEAAIRRAAGNPAGRQPLELPQSDAVERLAQPKDTLQRLLREASGLGPRRRRSRVFSARRVADETEGFAPLRRLSAFQATEAEVGEVVAERGWYVPAD